MGYKYEYWTKNEKVNENWVTNDGVAVIRAFINWLDGHDTSREFKCVKELVD